MKKMMKRGSRMGALTVCIALLGGLTLCGPQAAGQQPGQVPAGQFMASPSGAAGYLAPRTIVSPDLVTNVFGTANAWPGTQTFSGTAAAVFSGNVQYSGGSRNVLSALTGPANAAYFSNAGAAIQNCGFNEDPAVCGVGGTIPKYSSYYMKGTALQNATIPEYMVVLDYNLNSGKAPGWSINTAFLVNEYTVANGNLYVEKVASCTTAGSGAGPATTGLGIVDNTCTWDFVSIGYAAQKVGFYLDAATGPLGANASYAAVNILWTKTGDTGNYKVGIELDHQNDALDTSVIGKSAIGVSINGLIGLFPLTADLQITHPANGTKYAARYSLQFAGGYMASVATISDATTQDPISFEIKGTHSLGSIVDTAIAPVALNLQGTYSLAAINIGTGAAAININSGNTLCFNGALQCMSYKSTPGNVQMPAGSGNAIASNCGSTIIGAAGTIFCGVTPSGTESLTAALTPRNGTFRNFYARQSIAPGAGQTTTYTLRIAGVSQAITCQIAGASAVTCNDLVNTANVTAGQPWTFQIVNSAGAGNTVPQGLGIEMD